MRRFKQLPRWTGVIASLLMIKVLLWASLRVVPLPVSFLEGGYSTLHLAPNGQLLRITLSDRDQYRIHLPLSDISDDLKRGFVLYEDKYFRRHPGINPVSILRSAISNLRHGRVVMGGSTITMQIAKMMEPKPRTWTGKCIEVFRALQLESRYSKDELLAIYLNSVPMGGNIQGVGAAAYLYFGKSAKNLSLGESALLISLPRNPNRYRPDRYNEKALQQKIKILHRIGPAMGVPHSEVVENFDRVLPSSRRPNPHRAPHLLTRSSSVGTASIKRYTINLAAQAICEDGLQKTVNKLKREGSYNGAVIVVDNRTMNVLAYVGSPDFNDLSHGGQINGANILRSPGSLLKPFLYGAAIDKGLLTPRTLLYDIERNYDGYIPANFERNFRGPVPAENALIDSLNVPAVNLEFEMGREGVVSVLRRARLDDPKRNTREAGLSLVLGAYPMTLETLVQLYSLIPNQGVMRHLNFVEDENRRDVGVQVLSAGASYILATMLTKIERPDLPQSWEFTATRSRIAFKTGTSFGLRDAWCVGFNPDYTVGVWLGNADAKGSSALIGIKAAAPLLVSIFNDLTRYRDTWFERPESVAIRDVCALSGEAYGPGCTRRLTDFYLPGVTRSATCSIHQQVFVRKVDGVEVCRNCMTGPRADYVERTIELWPPDVAAYMRSSGKKIVPLPKHNKDCPELKNQRALKLRSPLAGGFYSTTEALDRDQQKIPLQVQARRGDEDVFWYLNDRLIGKGLPDQIFYVDPIPGEHKITVMDRWGDFDTVRFKVRRTF